MTTRGYVAIAEVIRKNVEYEAKREGPAEQRNAAIVAIQRVAAGIAVEMKKDNPRFGPRTFMQRCGLEN